MRKSAQLHTMHIVFARIAVVNTDFSCYIDINKGVEGNNVYFYKRPQLRKNEWQLGKTVA